MTVGNRHERRIGLDIVTARLRLAALASPEDRLWPSARWPALRLDGGLVAGARGGHGPVSYVVASVSQDEVVFQFERPFPFVGTHRFELTGEGPRSTIIIHELVGQPRGAMKVIWPLVMEPLHDALVEDAFDRLSLEAGEPAQQAVLARPVRVRRAALRWLTAPTASQRSGTVARTAAVIAVAGLGVAAAIHGAWATGSSWPMADKVSLGDLVIGASRPMPGAGACLAVAAALGSAAAATADASGLTPREPHCGMVARAAALGAAFALGVRGIGGLLGHLAISSDGSRFGYWDLRFYSPLCVALAEAILLAVRPRAERSPIAETGSPALESSGRYATSG